MKIEEIKKIYEKLQKLRNQPTPTYSSDSGAIERRNVIN